MKSISLVVFSLLMISTWAQKPITIPQSSDWLLKPVLQKASIEKSKDGIEITLNNGLLKRSFRVTPNTACVDYTNLVTGQQLLRAVSPEARLEINGVAYNVGGLYGQKEKAYSIAPVRAFTNRN